MGPVHHFEHGIVAIDAGYVRPLLAAIHLICENGRVAVIDSGAKHALGRTLGALKALGLGPDAVEYVILTHVHLDHAGGAGMMMRAFPNAQLVVHARGAQHMIDPSRLLAGAREVYGAEAVTDLYGEILPVSSARVVSAQDGMTIKLAGRNLICLDSPGHARHHICLFDARSRSIFAGDSFGLSYREMDVGKRQFIFPTTSPVQFDPNALIASLDRLLSFAPNVVYLTHYSQLRDVVRQADRLRELIAAHLVVARREETTTEDRVPRIRAGLKNLLLDAARDFGSRLSPEELLELFATDLELNAQGLSLWLDEQRAAH